MESAIRILYLDSIGGLMVGIFTLSLHSLLSTLFKWPVELVIFFGLANIVYGIYSGILRWVWVSKRKTSEISLFILILANSFWGGHCFTEIYYLQNDSSILGFLQLLLEGFYVIVLAFLELKYVLPAYKSSKEISL